MALSDKHAIYARIACALEACSFLPGSWDKRFARNMAAKSRHAPAGDFTEKQRVHLIRLAHRYRRQIPVAVIILAQEEAESAAGRRVDAGLPALANFSPESRPKRVSAQRHASSPQGELL